MGETFNPTQTDEASSPLDLFPSERDIDTRRADPDSFLEEFASESSLGLAQPSSIHRAPARRGMTGRAVASAALMVIAVVSLLGAYRRWVDTDHLPTRNPVQRSSSADLPREARGHVPEIDANAARSAAAITEPPVQNVPRSQTAHSRGSRAPASATQPVALVRGTDVGNLPAYSPSFDAVGETILFHAGKRGATSLLRATLAHDGSVGGVSVLMQDGASNYHAQQSPDGRWIAFDSDRDGTRGVYVADRSEPGHVRRVSGDGYAAVPRWSPDGTRLAFVRAEPGRPNVWNIWTLTLATGSLDRLTASSIGQPWGASWFPDSRRVAYSREDRLVALDTETGQERVFRSPIRKRLVRTPAVAPDGSRIVFQTYRDGTWVLDLMRGSMRRILKDPSAEEFAWSPDGTAIAFHSHRNGEWDIWTMMMPS